jgi:hypothetical protein
VSLEPPTTIVGWTIWAIVVLACVAIAWVAITQFGIPVPGWAITMLWIVLVACGAILAIRTVTKV